MAGPLGQRRSWRLIDVACAALPFLLMCWGAAGRSWSPVETLGVATGVAATMAAFLWVRGPGEPADLTERYVPTPGAGFPASSQPPIPREDRPAGAVQMRPERSFQDGGAARSQGTRPDPRGSAGPGRRRGSARRQPELRWYGPGESISVASFRLKAPMVYVCHEQPFEEEASCIDLSLKVGIPVREPRDSLGDYPAYEGMTPNQRANYLLWLSTGRVEPLSEIGYAFLFFYGLERRFLVEDQDVGPILKEVVRLLETYTTSSTFDGYLGRFLAFALARDGIESVKDPEFEAVFERPRLPSDPDVLAVALAWFCRRKAPLPVSWALQIARQDSRFPRSVVPERLPEQFGSLFRKRYSEQFGDGMILRASRRGRALTYYPASPSLLPELRGAWSLVGSSGAALGPIKLPDVLGLESQLVPLVKIWSRCVEELRPLSRLVARGIEAGTREAFEALPDDLKGRVEHPDKPGWDHLVAGQTEEAGWVLVEVSQLAALQGLEPRAKLTLKQSLALAHTAESVGLIVEPDSRVTQSPYRWEDLVSLRRPENPPRRPSDARYLAASLMLELGVFIAAADGQVEDTELEEIARFLGSQFAFDPQETRRLEALKRVLLARPPSITGRGKRLQAALSRSDRETVGRFLTGIAAADGIIDGKEVAALRSAYRALGVEIGRLNDILEELRRAAQEPVEVQRGEGAFDRGEIIPPGRTGGGSLTLDETLLKRLMAETRDVAAMLGAAMQDGDEGIAGADSPPAPWPVPARSLVEPRFVGLDSRFHAILSELLGRPVWSRADADSLIRGHQEKTLAVYEAINEWADEHLGDHLIREQDKDWVIQSDLLESRS